MAKVIAFIKAHALLILIVLVVLYFATTIYQCGRTREFDRQAKALNKENVAKEKEAVKQDAAYKEAMAKKDKAIAEKQKATDAIEAEAKAKIAAVNKIVFRSSKELAKANGTVAEYRISLEAAESSIEGWKGVVVDLNLTIESQKGVIAQQAEALMLAKTNIDRITGERDAAIKRAESMYALYKKVRRSGNLKTVIVAGIAIMVGVAAGAGAAL